ncbi:MAG: hypothetical protein ACI81R_000563 [Bradymonadia bacterium]|jgi:hypothetical protein
MRVPMKKTWMMYCLAASFCMLAACGDDEPETTADAGSDASADVTVDAIMGNSLVDPTFRLTVVDIRRPLGGIGTILENLIAADIDADLLHVLIQFRDFDTATLPDEFTVTGNAGEKVEGGYTWYPGVDFSDASYKPASIDSEFSFSNSETLSIIFPALEPGATEPLQIPVTNLSLTGTLEEDGDSWVLIGELAGAILADEISDLDVNISGDPDAEGQLLSELLGDRDYPQDAEEADLTGWTLRADIEAQTVTYIAPE